jgi:hypothetical protein
LTDAKTLMGPGKHGISMAVTQVLQAGHIAQGQLLLRAHIRIAFMGMIIGIDQDIILEMQALE